MLTINGRLYGPTEHIDTVSEYPASEQSEPVVEKHAEKPAEVEQADLLEKIRQIKKESEHIHRENRLFSRYLLRTNSGKIVRSFDDYMYDEDNEILQEILEQTRSINSARRANLKKNHGNARQGTMRWSRTADGTSEQKSSPYIAPLEKERFAIAAYEAQQTGLEWKRMNEKATAALYHLEIVFQSIDSDEREQETLNRELSRRVDKYRADVGEAEFNNPYMQVPGELVVSRINKRIHSRLSLIGLIRVNNTRLHIRTEEVLGKIRLIDDFIDRMEEVDVISMRMRKINNGEIYDKVDGEYRQEKCSQHRLLRRLQEQRTYLGEQEAKISEMTKKCALLRGYIKRTTIEIKDIQEEYRIILKENNFLKERVADVAKVPTIIDYAYLMHQIKTLQHEIDVWTQRIAIAETLLSQLKRGQKPPRRLPPLQSSASDVYL